MQGQGQGPSLQGPGHGLDLQGQGLDSQGPGQGPGLHLTSDNNEFTQSESSQHATVKPITLNK